MTKFYPHYLETDCWIKQIRRAALQRCNSTCEAHLRCCGARATEVHHMTYDNIGREQPGDVIGVCAACHRALHKINEPRVVAVNDNEPVLPMFDEAA